jgi:hypothetical protein
MTFGWLSLLSSFAIGVSVTAVACGQCYRRDSRELDKVKKQLDDLLKMMQRK